MKILKYISCLFAIGISLISTVWYVHATSSPTDKDYIKNQLLEWGQATVIDSATETWLPLLDVIFKFIKDFIYNISAFIVIAIFLFMGIRLIYARGNPDDFKKVMTQLIYVVVGIFIISVAFALVKLVAGLTIS